MSLLSRIQFVWRAVKTLREADTIFSTKRQRDRSIRRSFPKMSGRQWRILRKGIYRYARLRGAGNG